MSGFTSKSSSLLLKVRSILLSICHMFSKMCVCVLKRSNYTAEYTNGSFIPLINIRVLFIFILTFFSSEELLVIDGAYCAMFMLLNQAFI